MPYLVWVFFDDNDLAKNTSASLRIRTTAIRRSRCCAWGSEGGANAFGELSSRLEKLMPCETIRNQAMKGRGLKVSGGRARGGVLSKRTCTATRNAVPLPDSLRGSDDVEAKQSCLSTRTSAAWLPSKKPPTIGNASAQCFWSIQASASASLAIPHTTGRRMNRIGRSERPIASRTNGTSETFSRVRVRIIDHVTLISQVNSRNSSFKHILVACYYP